MMTPTRIVRSIGIAGLVGWLGMVGWVAKTTQAQNGGQNPPPMPPAATKHGNLPKAGSEVTKPASKDILEPLPVAPDPGPSSETPPAPLDPAAPSAAKPIEPLSPPPIERDVAPPIGQPSASEAAVPRTLAAHQPASAGDDPEQSAQSFVERNQKEAEDHLRSLTAEAEQLRGRLAKLESGIKKWQGLVNALRTAQGQPITSAAVAPGAEDAGDLEPIKPRQPGSARSDKRVKWATASGAPPASEVDTAAAPVAAQQIPTARPLQAVVPGAQPR